MCVIREVIVSVILLYNLVFCMQLKYNELLATSPRKDLNFTQLVEYDGYRSDTHTVVTQDGYVLTMFRVKSPCSELREPVIFMHGMYLSGDDCLIPGPEDAHCYIYARACHDVWVPNARGSRYSRHHLKLDPDTDSRYWNFTFDDMALQDTPAVIDYVLAHSEKSQVVYIGHSQGAAVLVLLCAKRPEYNRKIKVGFGLSPTAWLSQSRFFAVSVERLLSPLLNVFDRLGVYFELLKFGGISQRAARYICALSKLSYPLCSGVIFATIGYNEFRITEQVAPVVFGHAPAGTSVKNFLRWGQISKNGFAEYDHGEKNFQVYGQNSPPMFELRDVTMKWILIASENDYIADVRDVNILASTLPNAQICVLSSKSFGHLDFVFSKDIKKYITPTVFAAINNNTFLCL